MTHKIIEANVPFFSNEDRELAIHALKTSKGSKKSQYQDLLRAHLEEMFPSYGVSFFSNCTSAMYSVLAALKTLNKFKGNEVIIPALSWISTIEVVINAGLFPVLVDIDTQSTCLNFSKVREKISDRTIAVLATGLYGNMYPRSDVEALKNDYPDIYILEDIAESFGAADDSGRLLGNSGDITFLSFQSTKIVSAGQGGAALVKSKDIFRSIEKLKNHGIASGDVNSFYNAEVVGHNFNWWDVQASLALSQVRRLRELVEERRKIFASYNELLSREELDGKLQVIQTEYKQTFWLPVAYFPIVQQAKQRESFFNFCRANGVQLRPIFTPLYRLPAFRNLVDIDKPELKFPVSESLFNGAVTLPSAAYATLCDTEYVVEVIRGFGDC